MAQPVMLLTCTGGARILNRLNWRLGVSCYHWTDHGSFTSLTTYIRWDIPWQLSADGKYARNTLYNPKSVHDHILFGNHFDTWHLSLCSLNYYKRRLITISMNQSPSGLEVKKICFNIILTSRSSKWSLQVFRPSPTWISLLSPFFLIGSP